MVQTASVKCALLVSLLHGCLFVIADSGTETPFNGTTVRPWITIEFMFGLPTVSYTPFFDMSTPRNITGLVGHPVKLLCRVKNLRNRTVSWIRLRDIHLLTVGRYTYTSDQRFEVQHNPLSEEWVLRIRSPQLRDSGQYECQISTTPPIGQTVYLNVLEPETTISNGAELFIQAGSTINLTCSVQHTRKPPLTITWAHRDQIIKFDSARGGISLVTERGQKTISRLLIQRAKESESGVYTCGPNNAPAASINVHVVSGEHPAAMQQACGNSSLHLLIILLCSITLCLIIFVDNLRFGTYL